MSDITKQYIVTILGDENETIYEHPATFQYESDAHMFIRHWIRSNVHLKSDKARIEYSGLIVSNKFLAEY
jgi:hypothetical protein